MDVESARCFGCGEMGHLKSSCPTTPALHGGVRYAPPRAATFEAHLGRIQAHVEDWHGGLIDMYEKRRRIADENLSWYGPSGLSRLINA